MLFHFKKWGQTFTEKQVKTIFWRSHQKKVGESCATTFWASLGKFVQKSFAPPKIYLLLHQCSSTFLSSWNPWYTSAFVMEPPLRKIKKTRITCKNMKYFTIRFSTNKQSLQKLKSRKCDDSVVLAFLGCSCYIQNLVIRQTESISQIYVVPFSKFSNRITFGSLRIRYLIYIWTTLLITVHRCRSKQIFGGAKDFCPNFPKLARKVVRLLTKNFLPQRLLRSFSVWTPKNGLNLFFCKRWAPFFEVKQRWAPVLSGFSGILRRYSGI